MLVCLTDRLFKRYFIGPVLRLVPRKDTPQIVVVENIGQTPAHDVVMGWFLRSRRGGDGPVGQLEREQYELVV